MGRSIPDEDVTSIILESIPQSYNMYIAAITATLSLLNQTLLSTNLIDVIHDEADQCTIKNPESKKERDDTAFVAKESSSKGKKGVSEGSKKKKGKCFNCKKVGHYLKYCWAPGGSTEGQGPKQKEKGGKGKEKEVAAKVEEKDTDDDGVWMATTDLDEEIEKSIEKFIEVDEMWSTDEIYVEYDVWEECSPNVITSVKGDTITDLNLGSTEINDKVDEAVKEFIHEGLEEKIIIDEDEEAKTYMFTAIMLADSNSSVEMELYDSGAS